MSKKDLFFSNKLFTLTLDLKIILGIKYNNFTHCLNTKIKYNAVFKYWIRTGYLFWLNFMGEKSKIDCTFIAPRSFVIERVSKKGI